ncbi:hypothetical protein [Paraburkholderia sp. BL9I2N2]|uniref:hypothetical protein n=1 Tax=Paraburkholderia sp. BL9I2N2 TaxID=1938809 RepID=UPI001044F9F4|nr:hypothetical protein [Paraburkholderia sp. BL9I2N2]TCK97134.1 hypothetical protein B0G74_3836 [Paraburkholderia sp. BL9I2N2]
MNDFVQAANAGPPDTVDLKRRLWWRGFRCFREVEHISPSSPNADQQLKEELSPAKDAALVYAILEFQVYSLYSPFLAKIEADGKLARSDGTIRASLTQKLLDPPPVADGTWNDGRWTECLELWEDKSAGPRGYVCPLVIERLVQTFANGDENTDLSHAETDRTEVWWTDSNDEGRYFCARDFSGMFPIDPNDPAWRNAGEEPPPQADPEWLQSRRLFAWHGNHLEKGFIGVPWRVTELRPKILADKDAIYDSRAWTSIFRIVRAVSERECAGYFDKFQSYDNAFFSLPLFHFAVPGIRKALTAMPASPLGGATFWVDWRQRTGKQGSPPSLSQAGLRVRGALGTDDLGSGHEYDTGSAESLYSAYGMQAKLARWDEASLNLHESLELLRCPSLNYRIAMAFRTRPDVRDALWSLAHQRVRFVAHLPLIGDDLPEIWRGKRLGDVVTSEVTLAMAVRMIVFNPAFVVREPGDEACGGRTPVKVARGTAEKPALLNLMLAAWKAATGDVSRFETKLADLLIAKSGKGNDLKQIRDWGASLGAGHYRLEAAELQDQTLSLSNEPYTSPFFAKGEQRFADPFPLDTTDHHPAPADVPALLHKASFDSLAGQAGLRPGLPAAPTKNSWQKKTLDDARRKAQAREVQNAAACGRALLLDGAYAAFDASQKRTHPLFNQRWARLQLEHFKDGRRSALLCGPSGGPPKGVDACFILDATSAPIFAYDGRIEGAVRALPLGQWKAGDGAISNDDQIQPDAGSFGLSSEPVPERTLTIFRGALDKSGGAPVFVDSFRVTVDETGLHARLGACRMDFDLRSETSRVAASDFGFFVEFLAWRLSSQKDAAASAWLDGLGFILAARLKSETALFCQQLPMSAWDAGVSVSLWDGLLRSPRRPADTGELAHVVLSWPAMHRWRTVLRQSPLARRALYDAWRVRLRDVLAAPVPGWSQPTQIGWFQLFTSVETMTAIARWQMLDAASMKRVLTERATTQAIQKWMKQQQKGDISTWTKDDEIQVFREVVLARLPAGDLSAELKALPAATLRSYTNQFETLFDCSALQGTERSSAGVHHGVVISRPAGNAAGVALGLLTSASPVSALAQTAGGASAICTVTGIVPILSNGRTGKGAALMLPAPVQLTLVTDATQSLSVAVKDAPDATAQPVDLSFAEIGEAFEIETDVAAWLGGLGEGVALMLRVTGKKVDGAPSTWMVEAEARLRVPWLVADVVFARQEISGIQATATGDGSIIWTIPVLTGASLAGVLPAGLNAKAEMQLVIGIDPQTAHVVARLEMEAMSLDIPLGSPIATLHLVSAAQNGASLAKAIVDLVAGEVSVTATQDLSVSLDLQLAPVTISNVTHDEEAGKLDATSKTARVIPMTGPANSPFGMDFQTVSHPATPFLRFDGKHLRLHRSLLDNVPKWLKPDAEFCLTDAVGEMFGRTLAVLRCQVDSGKPPARADGENTLVWAFRLTLSLTDKDGGTVLGGSAATDVTVSCQLDKSELVLGAEAFAAEVTSLTFDFDMGSGRKVEFGSFGVLAFPPILKAKLDPRGGDHALEFQLDAAPIELRFLSDGGVIFDIAKLAFGAGGVSLEGVVRPGSADMPGLTVFGQRLRVRPAANGVGRFKVVKGRLTDASLEAEAQLTFFDDATGVVSMRLFEEPGQQGLSAIARFDVGCGRRFHVEALCLVVEVDSIHLSLRWQNQTWTTEGGITGSLSFEPSRALDGMLKEFSELFDGTRVHFENLNLANLGDLEVRVEFTPRVFKIAQLFVVTLRGLIIRPRNFGNAARWLSLLGDIEFIWRMPTLNFGLTLGEIALVQRDVSDLIPHIGIQRLGLSGGLPGGFQLKGTLQQIDNEQEVGFAGDAYVKTSSLPGMNAAIKLTRLKPSNRPALVVYVGVERNDHLAYGFFLRMVGLGVAVNQGLKYFSDQDARRTPLAQRVETAVQKGIPNPADPNSWVPVSEDGALVVSIVAYAEVSFGCLGRDVEHLVMTNMVLSVDEHLDVIAGINGWFYTSPNQSHDPRFIERPAMRGAIGLSVRDQVLYGRFVTLPKPMTGGDGVVGEVAQLLSGALSTFPQSVSIYSDPRGALVEVAYPRQARYGISLGPVRGEAELGFRFGFYRETQVIGLNLAARAEISADFSGDLGFANVELSARAEFAMQGAFAGAYSTDGRAYVLADLQVAAMFEIAAHVYKRIHVETFFCSFTVTLFDITASVRLGATASLAVAIVPSGIGFAGSVAVQLNVAGFGLSASLRIAMDEGRIAEARDVINRLVPPIDQLIQASSHASAMTWTLPAPSETPPEMHAASEVAAPASAPAVVTWRHHVRAVSAPDDSGKMVYRTRLVLFPDARRDGSFTPVQPASGPDPKYGARTHRLVLKPMLAKLIKDQEDRKTFLMLGGGKYTFDKSASTLDLVEQDDRILITADMLKARDPSIERPLFVGDLLVRPRDQVLAVTEKREVVDERTRHPEPGNFDDPAVQLDPHRRSTRFRIQNGDGVTLSYDEYLLLARQSHESAVRQDDGDGHWNAELLTHLLRLAEVPPKPGGAHVFANPAGADDFDPLLFAGALSLVLDFEDDENQTQFKALSSGGLADLVESAQMFGAAANLASASTRVHRIDPDWCQWFQGNGEVGLAWQLSCSDDRQTWRSDGPHSHDEIHHYVVRRKPQSSSSAVSGQEFEFIPHWPHWDKVSGPNAVERTFIRPRFGFVDTGLPADTAVLLTYEVEAFGGMDGKTSLVKHVFDGVWYRPLRLPLEILNAQATLERPVANPWAPATSAGVAGAPLRARLRVLVMVSGKDLPDEKTLKDLLDKRLKLWARPVSAGTVGRYGAGDETDMALAWSPQLQSTDLKLPVPAASRGRDLDLLNAARPVELSVWNLTKVDPKAQAPNHQRLAWADIKLPVGGNEADFWQAVGMQDDAAIELFVGLLLGDAKSGSNIPPAGTAVLRCRLALSDGPFAGRASAPTDADFGAGRPVAALERMPFDAQYRAEWLDAAAVVASPRVERIADDVKASVNIIWPHVMTSNDDRGVPVEYQVWWYDEPTAAGRADPIGAVASRIVAVQPERVFRGQQNAVYPTLRKTRDVSPVQPKTQTAQDQTPTQLDWRLTGACIEISSPQQHRDASSGVERGLLHELFAKATSASGGDVILCRSLANLYSGVFTKFQFPAGSRVSFDVAEALLPPAQQGDAKDRAAELLQRHSPDTDALCWKLLEALGASATFWIENDDECIGFESVEGHLRNDVVAIVFDRLPAQLRPPIGHSTLYAFRVFDVGILQELLLLAKLEGTDRQNKIRDLVGHRPADGQSVPDASPLQYALSWLAPKSVAKSDDSCEKLLATLIDEGLNRFRFVELTSQPQQRVARFTRNDLGPLRASTPADPAGGDGHASVTEGSVVLPAVKGWVWFNAPLTGGYGRRLRIAIECARRRDPPWPCGDDVACALRDPSVPYAVVRVPRTLSLQPDIAGLRINALNAIEAEVSVHPAQQLTMQREDLVRHIGRVRQSVALVRALDPRFTEAATGMHTNLPSDFDWEAYGESWHAPGVAASIERWRSFRAGVVGLQRGAERFAFPALPAGYRWSVSVRTTAGVRASAEGPPQRGRVQPDKGTIVPVYAERGKELVLAYESGSFAWSLSESALHLRMPFPRPIDALPSEVRNYWTARDIAWTAPDTDLPPVPVLCLADPSASWIISARTPDGGTRVDLLRIALEAGGKPVPTFLWRGLDKPNGNGPDAKARTVQFVSDAEPAAWFGRLGVEVSIGTGAAQSLDWLWAALGATDPGWSLNVSIERDGVRFACEEIR